MSQSKEKTEFHSIDVDVNENEEKDDDEDIVLHGSISKPLPKPANKYQSTSEKFFSNGSVISPSVQEEIYQKKLGNERKKQTLRQTFVDDDSDEENLSNPPASTNSLLSNGNASASVIAPIGGNMDDIEIMKMPKQKPLMKEKKSSKNKHGEKLTTESAVEFMIKERQMMDKEFAALRAENDFLKERVEKQQFTSQTQAQAQTPMERIIVEKVVEKKVIDPNSLKWREDAEALRKENEELKRIHAETQAKMRTQKQLASEAQEHRLYNSENNPSSHEPEEKDDPEDHSSEENESIKSVAKAKSQIPPRPKKSLGIPALDLSRTQSNNRPLSASSENKQPQQTQQPSQRKKGQQLPSPSSSVSQDYSGLPLLLWKGGILWKIPYNGNGRPERRHVVIKKASKVGKHSRAVRIITNSEASLYQTGLIFYPPTILWANPDKPDDLQHARELPLYEGAHVVEGYQSPAFWKNKTRGADLPPEQLCFSVITSTRSLDLAAENLKDAVAWKTAFHTLLIIMSSNPDWAIDMLNRKEPVFYHQQLEDPPDDYHRQQHPQQQHPHHNAFAYAPHQAPHHTPAPVPAVMTSRELREHEKYQKATKEGLQQQLETMKSDLFEATRNGDYERIQSILKKKKISVNVMMTGPPQDTPLMIACRLGMVDIVNLCLYYGAKNDPHPNIGQTALHCAVESRSFLCVQALLNAALPSQSDSIIANLKDAKNQQTPLHFTSSFGDVKIAKILISHGSDLSSRDKLSRTPLHICSYYGHKICLSYLLDSGGDSYLEVQDVYGNTALHYSAEQGHVACVKLLVETAANPIIQNNKGYLPYDLAQMKGHLPVCQILMAYNVIDPPALPLQHTSRGMSVNPLERHATYPSSSSDLHLPRPHTNRSTSGNQLGTASPSFPLSPYTHMQVLQQQQQQQQLMNQLYVDTAMSRSNSYSLHSGVGSGSLTARDRSSNLFQGLQMNNPLTARRMVDDELQSGGVGYHNLNTAPMSVQSSFQGSAGGGMGGGGYQPSFSPVTADFFYSTNPSISGYSSQSTEATPIDTAASTSASTSAALEKFWCENISWEVYQTDEGHVYYLDSVTQHSQWDDPREHGVIYYDEATGEYIRKESLDETNGEGEGEREGDLVVEDLNEDEDAGEEEGGEGRHFKQPRQTSKAKGKVEKQKKLKPQKIARVLSEEEESEEDDRQGRGNGNGNGNGERALVPKRISAVKKAFQGPPSLTIDGDGDGDSSDDGQHGRMYVRSGKYSKRSTGSRTRDRDHSRYTSSSLDSPSQSDLNISPVASSSKRNLRYTNSSSSLRVIEPDSNSTMIDDSNSHAFDFGSGEGEEEEGEESGKEIKTNCFSPDKASLKRAVNLQKSLSGVTTSTSPNGLLASSSASSSTTMSQRRNGSKKKKIPMKSSSELKISIGEEEEEGGEEEEGTNPNATMYSDAEDEEEGEGEGEDGSDWDAESDEGKRSQPSRSTKVTSTGPLGNVENKIKAQSKPTPGRKSSESVSKSKSSSSAIAPAVASAPAPVKSVKDKESTGKLKKEKIFSPDEGGYGNGGNTLPSLSSNSPFTPQESPSLFVSTIKDGGFSPRPTSTSQDRHNVKALAAAGAGEAGTSAKSTQQMISQIEPYLEMLRQGTPLVSVKNAMSKAGESRELIKFLIETADQQHILSSNSPATATAIAMSSSREQQGGKKVPGKVSAEDLNELKQDPVIGKYVKMHAMGVPVGNIEQKMKLDSVEASDLRRFLIATGQLSGESGDEEVDTPQSEEVSPRNPKGRKASVPLLKIHWSPLPAEKLSNSIFATARDDDDSMQDEEFEEFEKLFGAQTKLSNDLTGGAGGVTGGADGRRKEDPRMKLFVLEAKRAQNIIIGLTQFKSIASHGSLLRSICSLNDLNGQLNVDHLQNLAQLLPTLPEMKRLPDAEESHHPAEIFCVLASKFFPDLPKRLNCFITCLSFQENYLNLTQRMKKIIDACNEIISSDNLARVLQKMLTVGNIMNEGTYRGQAAGFSLDSLLKMVHTKGVDKKTSILDYVVKSLIDRGEQSTLRVAEDLLFDDETCRISGKDTIREIDQLEQSMKQIEETYRNAANSSSTQSELIQECTPAFCERLGIFLENSQGKLVELSKMRELMNRKITTVIEYFGEDEKTCETTKIFTVLKEFKTAFESSRVSLLGRMQRSKSRQLKSIQQN